MAAGQQPVALKPRESRGSAALVRQESFSVTSSPTPPPAHVEVYERLSPGATDRFLKLAEDEAAHRRAHENAHLVIVQENAATNRTLAKRGQWIAASVAFVGIGFSTLLGIKGAEVTAGILGGGTLVTIILAFLRADTKEPKKGA